MLILGGDMHSHEHLLVTVCFANISSYKCLKICIEDAGQMYNVNLTVSCQSTCVVQFESYWNNNGWRCWCWCVHQQASSISMMRCIDLLAFVPLAFCTTYCKITLADHDSWYQGRLSPNNQGATPPNFPLFPSLSHSPLSPPFPLL